MKPSEKRIRQIMRTEKCDHKKAERFFELSQMLISDSFTTELGKEIYTELKSLRA